MEEVSEGSQVNVINSEMSETEEEAAPIKSEVPENITEVETEKEAKTAKQEEAKTPAKGGGNTLIIVVLVVAVLAAAVLLLKKRSGRSG